MSDAIVHYDDLHKISLQSVHTFLVMLLIAKQTNVAKNITSLSEIENMCVDV